MVETGQLSAVDELWSEYKASGERATRDHLIVHYAPLVKYVAGRVGAGLPRSVDLPDLVSYGILGLIDAIEKFDPQRAVPFEPYAMARIRGAILDELRSIDWVPRSVRAKARAADRAVSRLEANLGRSPTDDEIAGELGISRADLRELFRQTAVAGVLQLDETLFGRGERGDLTLGDTIADNADGPGAIVEVAETRRILAQAISQLAEREKTVLTLYYYEGLNLAEIGEILGVTESRTCQIHTKAVVQLRRRMEQAMRETG